MRAIGMGQYIRSRFNYKDGNMAQYKCRGLPNLSYTATFPLDAKSATAPSNDKIQLEPSLSSSLPSSPRSPVSTSGQNVVYSGTSKHKGHYGANDFFHCRVASHPYLRGQTIH